MFTKILQTTSRFPVVHPHGGCWTNSCRTIHARAQRMPHAERQRRMACPIQNYQSPRKSRVVLLPTRWDSPGRSEKASEFRKSIQLSRTPSELLSHVKTARHKDQLDQSVLGAAMQRAGQGRWWDALRQIRHLQKLADLRLNSICLSIYLRALARSVRGEQGHGAIRERQQSVLMLGKQAWNETMPFLIDDIRGLDVAPCTGAALSVCYAAGHKDHAALEWASEINSFARQHCKELGIVHYASFARVLESHHRLKSVDDLINHSAKNKWSPDCVFLGGLVAVAAERRDWQRAEQLWDVMVKQYHVEPHSIAYQALAKAHFLAGRPDVAAGITDDMLQIGMDYNASSAQDHIQALLIVCHSSLSTESWNRLSKALSIGELIIMREGSKLQRSTLAKLKAVVSRLKQQASSMALHDVLVEWKAQRSEMSEWPNHQAGTNYIKKGTRTD